MVTGLSHAVYHFELISIVIIFKQSEHSLTVALMAHEVQQNHEYS